MGHHHQQLKSLFLIFLLNFLLFSCFPTKGPAKISEPIDNESGNTEEIKDEPKNEEVKNTAEISSSSESASPVITDNLAPEIELTIPASGAVSVARNAQIFIILNEGLDENTLTSDHVILSGTVSGIIETHMTYDPEKNKITIDPETDFAANETITVTLMGFADLENNTIEESSFQFALGDIIVTTPPSVVSTLPTEGENNIIVNPAIRVRFSTAIAPASLNQDQAVILKNSDTAKEISVTKSYDNKINTLIVKPIQNLNPNQNYTLTLDLIYDENSIPLSQAVSLNFTTKNSPSPDVSAPVVISDLAKKAFTRATLSWTSPGNDATAGTALFYDLRYSENPITNLTDFNEATPILNLPTPLEAGSNQEITLTGITEADSYYYVLLAGDEAGNLSAVEDVSITFNADTVFGIENLSENQTLDYFGRALSGRCDFNADGFDDFIVSSGYDDDAGTDAGKVFIYLGSDTGTIGIDSGDATGGREADIILESTGAGDHFGQDVTCLGDFNNDGFDDIAVGAPYRDPSPYANSGEIYIYYGSDDAAPYTLLAVNADLIIRGTTSHDYFGWSLGRLGDINGDGLDDLITVAPYADFESTSEGLVSIFLGDDLLSGSILYDDTFAETVIEGDVPGSNGRGIQTVADGGDVDGDGINDLFFAAPTLNTGQANAGEAYLYLSSSGTDPFMDVDGSAGQEPNAIISGENATDYLGGVDAFSKGICLGGDLNSDGFGDLVVAGHGIDAAGTDRGQVYIFFGKNKDDWASSLTPSTDADVIITGQKNSDFFGYSLDCQGDYNNDGIDDLIVGAPFYDNSTAITNQGGVFVFFGKEDWASSLNAFDDKNILISHTNGFYEDIGLDNTSTNSDLWGSSVKYAGDINGDGYDDILIGAYGNETAGRPVNAGAIYLVY